MEPRSLASPPHDGFAFNAVALAEWSSTPPGCPFNLAAAPSIHLSTQEEGAGPWARPQLGSIEPSSYQWPVESQPPLFALLQVRVTGPPFTFVMVKSVPDFEWPTMV
jgi:hypothetical protein